MTWEFDEIVAGGQSDRYAMVQMFAPYGTLINDPKISKTGGKWAWTTVQGPHSKDEGRTWIDGHFLGVPKYTKNKEWSLEFIQMACSKRWQKRAMDTRQRAAAAFRAGGPRDGRDASAGRRSPRRRSRPAFRRRAYPVWDTLEIQLRSALSQALFGQKTPKQALDDLTADWQRSLRRAGIGR